METTHNRGNKDKNFTQFADKFCKPSLGFGRQSVQWYESRMAEEERSWHGKTMGRIESRVPGTRIERKTCAEP